MEIWAEVRRRVLAGEISKREACREYHLHWDALQKILEHEEPPGYRRREAQAKPSRPRACASEHDAYTLARVSTLRVHGPGVMVTRPALSFALLNGVTSRCGLALQPLPNSGWIVPEVHECQVSAAGLRRQIHAAAGHVPATPAAWLAVDSA
jgi:hypothetical protein